MTYKARVQIDKHLFDDPGTIQVTYILINSDIRHLTIMERTGLAVNIRPSNLNYFPDFYQIPLYTTIQFIPLLWYNLSYDQ